MTIHTTIAANRGRPLLVILVTACIVAGCDGAEPKPAALDAGEASEAGLEDADAGMPPFWDASIVMDSGAAGEDGSVLDVITFQDGDMPDAVAVGAPRAGFQLSLTAGTIPLWVQATSSAGDGAFAETLYDWGEGGGWETRSSHRYLRAGNFTVTQRVRNGDGHAAMASAMVSVLDFSPVRFSTTDHSAHVFVSRDGYALELRGWGPGGARSDGSVSPGSGVYYFEGQRLVTGGLNGLGLATAQASLNEEAGSTPQSMGVLAWGRVQSVGGSCSGSSLVDTDQRELGFVLDYRANTPVVHVLTADGTGTPAVRSSCTMVISAPLFVFYSGERAVVGDQVRVNTGADTTNHPFRFSEAGVRAALSAYGDAAAAGALVMGFGKTRAGRLDSPPTLVVPADLSVPAGQTVTLEGSASDLEDGSLTERIVWTDLASLHHAPLTATGARLAFTPSTLGRHPIEVTVEDLDGVVTKRRVLVDVTGSLSQFNPVQLTRDPGTGRGITLSEDALSARFDGPSKEGIRANQGVYGRFRYFEVHRNVALRNLGIGLVVGDGGLNPYDAPEVPWSCSVNVERGFWVNLISAGDWTGDEPSADYGFAVDYRGEHPRVHILIRGAVQTSLELTQVWLPLYPLLYGNPADVPTSGMELTINFGATPFRLDPRAILAAAGIDASGLELGWGDATLR